MAQTPDSVLADLKNNKYAPIYFLQGDEPYYIDLISNYIEKNALEESEKGFNQMIMYGKDVDMNAVITNARRFPMMAQRQVVIVKEAQEIQDIGREAGVKQLEAYLNQPLPTTILVFCHKYKSIDGRKPISKLLDKQAILVNTKKLYDNQVPDWVAGYVREKGFGINTKSTHMIAEFVGNNLERITNEIDKMLINYNSGSAIDEAMVEKHIGVSKEYNVFELQKSLVERNVVKANKIVNYFEANPKSNPLIPIVAALFSFYSKLLLGHHAKDKSDKNLASVLKVNPYFVKEYKMALRNYSLQKVIENVHHLRKADMYSKGIQNNSAAEGQILKELIFKLLH
ncbi:DNA polymerase III subunit delta [Fulvivirgaceae bacterium BMA10]|uniref:DNA polymerase III subunit delta n=1 Tax=Splendidivirga corallicola TaxID=3051826 RepID=A0ABT8KTW5_9BACT|nr:DNA polymerase III subunit delta [Fulvivirgaceae bacterium BMA10]